MPQDAEKISPSRRRWQFRLSTALVALSVVAVLAAWGAYEKRIVRERFAWRDLILERGGSAYTVGDLALDGPTYHLRRWLGDEPISTIYLPPPHFTNDDFASVRATFPEAYIYPHAPLESTAATSDTRPLDSEKGALAE